MSRTSLRHGAVRSAPPRQLRRPPAGQPAAPLSGPAQRIQPTDATRGRDTDTRDGNAPSGSVQALGPAGAVDEGIESGKTQTPPPEPAGPADSGLPDAAEVHRLLKSLQGVGNQTRLKLIDTLRLLYDGHLFFELGYSSYHQYCDRELGLSRSTCYEYLRVVMALECLPASRVIYGQGELSWGQLRAISRVATTDTELAWLEFAFREPVGVLLAEVSEAQRTGRNRPRDRRFGLPNLTVGIYLEVTVEERQRIRSAFQLVNAACPDLGSGPDAGAGHWSDGTTERRLPLVRWADGILSGDFLVRASAGADRTKEKGASSSPGTADSGGITSGAGHAAVVTPAQTIVYHLCPTCRAAMVDTDEGAVSVTPSRIAELEAVSNRVVITEDDERPAEALPPGQTDPPNEWHLARKVLHRDGLRCANPGCGRRENLHAHHITFRCEGGRTAMSNEVTVCDRCHALLHQGLLEVTGSPHEGLVWRRLPLDPSVELHDPALLTVRLERLAAQLRPPTLPARAAPGPSSPLADRHECAASPPGTGPTSRAPPAHGLPTAGALAP